MHRARYDSLTEVQSLQRLQATDTQRNMTELVVAKVKVGEPASEYLRDLYGVGAR